MALVEIKSLHPRAERKAERVDHRRAGNPSAARRDGDHVAVAVGGRDVNRARTPWTRVGCGTVAQRAHRNRIAGPLIHRGVRGIDKLAANRGVAIAQQPVERNVDEFRIAVVRLAIGERELGGLDDGVDVVGGVVAHRGEVEALEQLELLQKYRALRPWPALEDRDAAIVGAHRRFDSRREAREVGGGEQAAVGVGPCDDVARDVAAIEALARRVEASLAPAILRG